MKFHYLSAIFALSQAYLAIATPIQGDISKRQKGPPDLGKPGADPNRACCRVDATNGLGVCPTEETEWAVRKEWILHLQVTKNLECGGGGDGCSKLKTESQVVGWGANVGANTPFTSIGFGVQESIITGESESCSAKPGETVCIWTKVKHMETDIRMVPESAERDTCQGLPDAQPHGPYRWWAPIEEETAYCVHGGACRGLGQRYWQEL